MNDIYLTRDEIEHPYADIKTMVEDKLRAAEQMSKTLFARTTASPEVLAEKLVFNIPFVTVGGAGFNRWYSTIEPFDEDIYYYTKAEAIAATVEKLKEVCDE